MSFNLWSETNTEAHKSLIPDFGLRYWNNIPAKEKVLIWKHLESYFFHISEHEEYRFYGQDYQQTIIQNRIVESIYELNKRYKAKIFGKNYFDDPTEENACTDFYNIFLDSDHNVVLEMLSFYCKIVIEEDESKSDGRSINESEEDYENRIYEESYKKLDQLAIDFNEVFAHFGFNVTLTRMGFIPKQDEIITENIVTPVLKSLSESKWAPVSKVLSDSFIEYRKGTPDSFSVSVTHSVSAVQAFLQILVNGQIGEGDISKLLVEAKNKNLIPSDLFTTEVFKKIQGFLMSERQQTGVAHPTHEYANEKNARLVLNLSLIFFQHCLS